MTRRIAAALLLAALVAVVAAERLPGQNAQAPSSAGKPPFYPDKSKLLMWLDADGKERPVKTVADWAKRREHVLRNMQEVMGPLPAHDAKLPLDVQVLEEVKLEKCVRRKISYVAEPGDRVTAYLFLPNPRPAPPAPGANPGEIGGADGRRPAVLCLHPTNRQIGKGVVAGLGTKTNRAYAVELADRGYVTLAPDYPNSGDHKPDVYGKLGYVSNTMKAIVDNRRGLDLLCSMAEVDAERIGCVGHSLGGHNTIFTAVFDQRIKAAVSCCGFTAFARYMKGDLRGWSHDGYMPRIIKEYGADPKRMPFDFHELVAAIAPRAFLAVAPERDDNFDPTGVREVMTSAAGVYELNGVPGNLRVIYPDAAHDFPNSSRATAYAFFDHHLRGLPLARAADEPGPKLTPLTPAQELATFRVQPGFRVELVAAEPDVIDPVSMSFDEHGRLYVVEMPGYPNEGSGEGPTTTGRIKLLTLDENGRCSKSVLFAEGFHFPTSVTPYGKGVIVGSAPDILYLEDTDGDGKADVRKVLYTGFGRKNIQAMLNHLQWGIDNRIHGAGAANGGEITSPAEPKMKAVILRGRNFSFDPRDLNSFEAESGGGQYALAFDDYGRVFTNDNSHHIRQIVLPDRYLRRNPHLAVPSVIVDIGVNGPVSACCPSAVGRGDEHGPACRMFRISPDEGWRTERTTMRAGAADKARFAATELVPSGYGTSTCGLMIYRGGLFAAEYHGNAFCCDPANNLLHRDLLGKEGPQVPARRADIDCEFLASTDIFFRPADLATGPDGAIYVADFYRQVIETPASLPEVIKKKYPLESWGRGRIWKIVPAERQEGAAPTTPAWKGAVLPGRMNVGELVGALESPNAWVRLTAQRMLVTAHPAGAAVLAAALDKAGTANLTRVHAMWTLEGLGESGRARDVARRLTDTVGVVHALRVLERDTAVPVPGAAFDFVGAAAESADVAFQFAFYLGEYRGEAVPYLATLAKGADKDQWLQTAILSAPPTVGGKLFREVLGARRKSPSPVAVRLAPIAGAVATRGDVEFITEWISAGEQIGPQDLAVFTGYLQGARRNPDGKSITEDLTAEVRKLSRRAIKLAGNPDAPVADRAGALRLIALGMPNVAMPILKGFLAPDSPGELQLAAVQTLSSLDDPRVAATLLSGWGGYTPSMRREVIEALFARADRLPHLLDAVEKGKVGVVDLDPLRRQALRTHSNAAIRARAEKLPAGISTDRAKVVDEFRPALEFKSDPAAGKAVFKKHCIVCHKLEGEGVEVGPDLAAALRNKTRDLLLNDILDPSREVDPRYRAYAVLTRDGRTITGMLAAETGSSLTLRREKQAEDLVLRTEIDQVRATPNSVMPEGFEKHLSRQELADLIGYLLSTVGR